jgi:uncharacterized cupredoxin-like copper-binding protein
MKKISLILGLILLLGLILTACASSGGSGSSNTLNVAMTDFKFDPSSLTVAAGKPVTINIKNNGSVQHNFTVMSKPVNGSYSDADKANVLFTSEVVDPGSSKTVNFTAPATPGDYQVICTVPGHFEAGMVGHLIVK